MKKPNRIQLLIIFLALAFLVPASFAQSLSVGHIRFAQKGANVRLQMKLNAGSDFRAFVLSDPYRIIVDLPSFEWRAHTIEKPQNFVVSDIRQGPLQKGISRIVFDLKEPVQIQKATSTKNHDLVIEFTTTTPEIFRAHKNDVFGKLSVTHPIAPEMKKVLSDLTPEDGFLKPASLLTAPTAKTPTPLQKPKYKAPASEAEKPLIVIDPGHGGIDPGAIGADNQKEKDVVLALGLDLRDMLLASGRYRVEMTRSKDTFLALKDRVNFARSKEADLFISLHADSIHKPDVHGTSVYTLSQEASDAQTAKLAEKENKADLIAGVDLSVEDEQVAFILGDFLITETLNQSKFFANTLVARMKDYGVYMLDNTHRYAGFAVLKAPDIPSILVEAGFMSNKNEARLLSQHKHRKKISEALTAGIDAYFDHIGPNKSQP